MTNIRDSLLRRVTNGLVDAGRGWLTRVTNGYDAFNRLALVSDQTNAAGHSYVPNSPLVRQLQFTNAGQLRVTETRAYDFFNRLTQIESLNTQPTTLSSSAYAYTYNDANQRTSITNLDNSRWNFGYDARGQFTSGKRAWAFHRPNATPAAFLKSLAVAVHSGR